MTILVTGATGYIGREFVKKYNSMYDIVVLVRHTSDVSKLESLNCIIKHYKTFEEIDFIVKESKIAGIVHFASNVIISHDIKDIDEIMDSNIKYGTFLLEACKKNNIKWFINTGTFWQNYQNDDYNPVNLYAATKEAFQNIAKYYTETTNMVVTTIKLNDTFGPNDTRPKIFNLWNEYSKSGKTLEMSKGEQIIDISYIDDILNAFVIMIENLQKPNIEKYNNKSFVVSSNQRMTLKELSYLFIKVSKKQLNIDWGGKLYKKREVMVPYQNGKKIPNWKQKYSLEEAIINSLGEDVK